MTTSTRDLNICTWNCRGVSGKFHELDLFLRANDVHVALLTETKLSPTIDFYISGFKFTRADHPSNTRKGGSAIFVRASLNHNDLPPIRKNDYQIARINMPLNGRNYITAFYSAPENIVRETDFQSILQEMGPNFILGGDLNAKHPRWGSTTSNPRGRSLINLIHSRNLEVLHPSEATHFPDNPAHSPDVLDFFLSKNAYASCSSPEVLHELSSDHLPVLLRMHASTTNTARCNQNLTNRID